MRSYADPCGIARALDAVGERWALLVVRELLLGPRRFSDLARSLPGVSQNVLSQRLRELADAEVVTRRRLGPPVSGQVYELTERGHALRPVLRELGRWGSRGPLPGSAELSPAAFALALESTVAADAPDARVELRLDDHTVAVTVAGGRASTSGVPMSEPQAVLTGTTAALRAITFGGAPLSGVTVTGDAAVAERFARSFPRPLLWHSER